MQSIIRNLPSESHLIKVFLWDQTIHHRPHKSMPLHYILSQLHTTSQLKNNYVVISSVFAAFIKSNPPYSSTSDSVMKDLPTIGRFVVRISTTAPIILRFSLISSILVE